jgi:class 3 adenylate cyclase
LETLYGAFDEIAKRRLIFKIETIGDCYVAVAGVPEPMIDHAVAMCRFAHDILTVMRKLTREMETSLGPDTGDLSLRIGLHSGPVTAGVLRGERARFQLFGDTMNTAARMEQTGMKNRIQVSQSTADCLHTRGKRYV